MDFWHDFDDDDDDPDWQENDNRGHSMGAVIILQSVSNDFALTRACSAHVDRLR